MPFILYILYYFFTTKQSERIKLIEMADIGYCIPTSAIGLKYIPSEGK